MINIEVNDQIDDNKKNTFKKLHNYNKSKKRFKRRLRSKEKKKIRSKEKHSKRAMFRETFGDLVTYENLLEKWLPVNIRYLISCDESVFSLENITKNMPRNNQGVFKIPENFSLVEKPDEAYDFLGGLIGAFITQYHSIVTIDYSFCKQLGLGAQALLDILLKEYLSFHRRCSMYKKAKPIIIEINAIGLKKNKDVRKMLFTVGSPVVHLKTEENYSDVVASKLCIHDRDETGDPIAIREQKDLDTTDLVDYVIQSLARLDRVLTSRKREDLSKVIGEVLINAEEHSTTRHRFSIGYFQKKNENDEAYGIFRLVIMNFGKTIYEKFADVNCPNVEVVDSMKELSRQYTKKNFFKPKQFEEETLWTLYSLQEGVTSVPKTSYLKRGNGSIQFIESFFNIKGEGKVFDNFSTMTMLSGNTSITFDGTYNINKREKGGEEFSYMTFNDTGLIEDAPDPKYVKYEKNYFPGTMISAKIRFNEDDFKEI
jgi:hypothetical protein